MEEEILNLPTTEERPHSTHRISRKKKIIKYLINKDGWKDNKQGIEE